MPYTKTEKKLFRALVKKYGSEKGRSVFYAMSRIPKYKKLFSAKTLRKMSTR